MSTVKVSRTLDAGRVAEAERSLNAVSSSPIARLVRPAILLVAGTLFGQGALAVAAPSAPAAVQTRIANCAGFDFHLIDSRTVYRWEGRILYRVSNQGDGWFMCPAHLPHRAVMTDVRFTVRDAFDEIELECCGPIRTPLAVTGVVQPPAFAVVSTGMSTRPGTRRFGNSDIDLATVDNGKFTARSSVTSCSSRARSRSGAPTPAPSAQT